MNTLYDSFLTYIRCELNESAHTVASYGYDLRQWEEFTSKAFGPSFDPLKVVLNDLRQWVAYLATEGKSARTIRRKVQTLRALYHYLMKRGYVDDNPAEELVTARMPKSLPRVIRPEDMKGLLDSPFDRSDFISTRNRLIITMLYSTGMRASELTGLLNVNVDTNTGELKVLGKRNKERIIPFGNELTEMISLYRTLRPADSAPQLFVEDDGCALTYPHLNAIVKGELAGRVRASKTTAHALRHSFATDMLNSGAEITAVQQLMGHASLAATQIYTHLSYRELQHNYQLAHPRAQKKG